MSGGDLILQAEDVVKHFPIKDKLFLNSGSIHAVDGVTLDLHEGEVVGVVGESGCGKSTLANMLMLLDAPTSGRIFSGQGHLRRSPTTRPWMYRRQVQMVFQDTFGSLDPRMTITDVLTEPFSVHRDILAKEQWNDRVRELLALVGPGPRSR